jgi:beta-phosphoglucomutase
MIRLGGTKFPQNHHEGSLAFIFDLDGVLVDSMPLIRDAHFQVLRELGVDTRNFAWDELAGRSSAAIWDFLTGWYGLPGPAVSYRRKCQQIYGRAFETGPLLAIPGARDFALGLKGSFPIALATSGSPGRCQSVLKQLSMETTFDVVVTGDMVTTAKPDPEIFSLAAKLLKVLPAQTIVIEDTVVGCRAALGAGMFCLLFSAKATPADLANLRSRILPFQRFEAGLLDAAFRLALSH